MQHVKEEDSDLADKGDEEKPFHWYMWFKNPQFYLVK